MNDRKGVLTPEQENILDSLIKLDNGLAESLDGTVIQLIDNQAIERIKSQLNEKYPGVLTEYVYPIIDAIFLGIKKINDK